MPANAAPAVLIGNQLPGRLPDSPRQSVLAFAGLSGDGQAPRPLVLWRVATAPPQLWSEEDSHWPGLDDATLVLLDEPSMGLAPIIVQEIYEIVVQLNLEQQVSFLIAEQNINVALKYATRAHVLGTGRVVLSGTADELLTRVTCTTATWASTDKSVKNE